MWLRQVPVLNFMLLEAQAFQQIYSKENFGNELQVQPDLGLSFEWAFLPQRAARCLTQLLT